MREVRLDVSFELANAKLAAALALADRTGRVTCPDGGFSSSFARLEGSARGQTALYQRSAIISARPVAARRRHGTAGGDELGGTGKRKEKIEVPVGSRIQGENQPSAEAHHI